MNREVVAWLRTPEGEQWSRQRIERARWRDGDPSPASYLEAGLGPLVLVMPGMFSVKEQ